jgi:putative transposase
MNSIYKIIGISKQNFHQRVDYLMEKTDEKYQILRLIKEVRRDHPAMSARYMYRMLNPIYIGRDKFEALCYENGFRVRRPKNYRRTTDSRGVTRFANLLPQHELTGVNQVLVSDITYYEIRAKFYYLTFIMDLYSRKIKGYSVSESLRTQNTTIPALKMVLKGKDEQQTTDMIIHSDGGGQYYSKDFRGIILQYKMRSSMGENVYENPHAERLNGIIKNSYLIHYNPQSFKDLTIHLKKAVDKYNQEKPHKALNYLSPDMFENTINLSTENQIINKRKKEAKKENLMMIMN